MRIGPLWSERILIGLFCLGWVTFEVSLFDIAGRYSVTLLLLAACLFGLRIGRPRSFGFALAGVLGTTVAAFAIGYTNSPDLRPGTHLIQQFICVALAASASRLQWARVFDFFRGTLFAVGVAAAVYGAYQLPARTYGWEYSFLPVSNIQYETSGFQRGATLGTGSGAFTRVSSFFVEPADYAAFGLWLFCIGLGSNKAVHRITGIGLAILAVFLSRSLGGVLAISLVSVCHRDVRWRTRGAILVMASALALTAGFWHFFPGQSGPFITRVTQAFSLDNRADSGRVLRIPSNLAVALETPLFGHGLGVNREVEPNGISIGVLVLLIERGGIGTAFFVWPYVAVTVLLLRRAKRGTEISRIAYALSIANLFCMFGWFASLYFPPFWFTLGFSIWACRKETKKTTRALAVDTQALLRRGRETPLGVPLAAG